MCKLELGYNIHTETPTLGLSLEDKMLKTTKLTQARLKELLHYDPETGIFTYARKYISQGRKSSIYGNEAGCMFNGYRQISIDNKRYYAHRLVFLYEYGYFPKGVDHKNHIRNDNRLCNLRETTQQENCKNMSVHPKNTSGTTGVSRTKTCKWVARIMANGKYLSLGTFAEKEDAIKARLEANIKYGFHRNHGRKK